MAYAAAVTVWVRREAGRRVLEVEVVETECGTASVWSPKASASVSVRVNNVALTTGQQLYIPRRGRVLDYSLQKVSGVGATLTGALYKVQVPTSKLEEILLCDAATSQHLLDAIPYDFGVLPSTLFGKSAPASGADNVVHTRLTIIEGLV